MRSEQDPSPNIETERNHFKRDNEAAEMSHLCLPHLIS